MVAVWLSSVLGHNGFLSSSSFSPSYARRSEPVLPAALVITVTPIGGKAEVVVAVEVVVACREDDKEEVRPSDW